MEGARPRKRQRRLARHGDGSSSSSSSDGSDESDVSLSEDDGPGNTTAAAAVAAARRGPRLLQGDEVDDDEEDGISPNRLGDRRTTHGGNADEDEEGEDLEEDAERDYRVMPELDRYDDADLDEDNEYDPISVEARRAAERLMGQRDAQLSRHGMRMPGALQDSDDDDDDDDDDGGDNGDGRRRDQRDIEAARRRRMRDRVEYAALAGQETEEYQVPEPIQMDLQALNQPISDALRNVEVKAEVRRRFRSFLTTFTGNHHSIQQSEQLRQQQQQQQRHLIYEAKISAMCASNKQSLLISYDHLMKDQTDLAVWLAEAPREMLRIMDQVAREVVLQQFPEYGEIHNEIFVRVTDMPIADVLRDLRVAHLNVLVKVSGVVTRRTHVVPELKLAAYKCTHCQALWRSEPNPIGQALPADIPVLCPECETGGKWYELDATRTIYRNFQIVTLQESPGSVPAGRVPRYKSVYVCGDLIDAARPGEEVEVTGIYENMLDLGLNSSNGFPVFSTRIVANYIQKKEDVNGHVTITEADKVTFRKMAKDPHIAQRIIGSVAPSIYGCNHVKTGLAMALFGGREKNINDKHRIRGDINVLLMGDPGTAKSQCLKYCEKAAPRAVYTTGKGASAVGLTAAVHKDPITREWTLEGGALVLADKGMCLIDEFDKMNDKDRTSIHEAMEQQSISISKAGIVTTLQARCSVIAAANPIGGRYDPQRSFADNVELTDPILQRFDILCVLQDTVDPNADERLAKFVVSSHVHAHPGLAPATGDPTEQSAGLDGGDDEMQQANPLASAAVYAVDEAFDDDQALNEPPGGYIPMSVLKKYILYARSLKPQLQAINQEKVAKLYGELRRESVNSGGVPIAVRHIESIMRMSEAYARMHLREHVRDSDVDMAIRVMLESFIAAQKYSAMKAMRRTFHRYLTFNRDNDELLLHLLEEMVKDHVMMMGLSDVDGDDLAARVEIRVSDFAERARELKIYTISDFLQSVAFRRRRFVLEGQPRSDGRPHGDMLIVKTFM